MINHLSAAGVVYCGMRRCLFNIATALSLLLLVATVVFWVRSYWRIDAIRLERVELTPDGERRSTTRWIGTYPSVVAFTWSSWPASAGMNSDTGRRFFAFDTRAESRPLFPRATWENGFALRFYRWKFLRMAWWNTGRLALRSGGYQENRAIIIPDWLLVTVLLILPAIWIKQFRRRRQRARRQLHHQCVICGYDLAGNISGVCPECGSTCESSSSDARSAL